MTRDNTQTVLGISKQMKALRSLPLMAALSVFLLFAQAVEHGHSHDADLQAQFDCDICLKIGSLDGIAVAEASSLDIPSRSQSYSALIQNRFSAEPALATARAPPTYA